MSRKVIEIPGNKIIPAGRSLGLEPNLLSGLSGFPESAGTCGVESEWEELLPVLLSPGKVSMLMKGDRERAVALTSISVVKGKILVYSGEPDGNLYIQVTDPLQLRKELMTSIELNTPAKEIVLPMSLDSLFVLSALTDYTKKPFNLFKNIPVVPLRQNGIGLHALHIKHYGLFNKLQRFVIRINCYHQLPFQYFVFFNENIHKQLLF
jgi:hypothetical protein